MTVSPDGAHVYAAGYDEAAVAVFARAPSTGALTFVEVQRDVVGGVHGLDEPTAIRVSPDGAHVYVAGEEHGTIVAFERNPASGVLTFVESLQDGVGGVDGLAGAAAIAISPDGAHVYVVGADEDRPALFARNASTGALAFSGATTVPAGLAALYNMDGSVVLSPNGTLVYVARYFAQGVSVFARDTGTGTLTLSAARLSRRLRARASGRRRRRSAPTAFISTSGSMTGVLTSGASASCGGSASHVLPRRWRAAAGRPVPPPPRWSSGTAAMTRAIDSRGGGPERPPPCRPTSAIRRRPPTITSSVSMTTPDRRSAKITARGEGAALDLPSLGSLTLPLVVQLQTAAGPWPSGGRQRY